jgi:hypothetical protein
MAEPALVFRDRGSRDEWRVEWFADDGSCEVAIFAGPRARERALRYADRQYGLFEEVDLGRYP